MKANLSPLLLALAIATPLQNTTAQTSPAAAPSSISSASARSAEGLTEPARDAVLGAEVAGIIGAQFFKEGDTVREGELILELHKEIEELEVARRRTLLDLAKSDLARTRKLAASTRSVSAEEVERATAQHAIAEAEHGVALAELRARQVFAPFTGQISNLFGLEPGEIARVQYPLVRLVDTHKVNFITHIEARDSGSIKTGDTVPLELDSDGTTVKITGRVAFVSPVIDSSSGLLRVRVAFDNPDGKVRPGAAGTMRW